MARGSLRLRSRLLLALLLPLSLAAIGLGVAGYWLIANVAERTNDHVLAGSLGAIAETVAVEDGEVTLDLPPAAFGMLENAERDNVYYRITRGRDVLTGYTDLPAFDPAVLRRDQVSFRYATYRGHGIRIAATLRRLPRIDQPVVVEVAETLDGRASLRHRLLRGLLFVEAALLGLVALLTIPALIWSLRPLTVLRRAVEARTDPVKIDFAPLGVVAMPRELLPLVTAFNRLLERLDTATSGLRRFTADASHQMRTPLSVLKVQLALANRGDEQARTDALHEIALATGRLERLLIQLLALARAQEDGVATPTETVDLREVATAVVLRWIDHAIEAGVEIRLEPDEGRFLVQGYRTLIFEMMSNLVDNGIRYNRPQGELAILLSRSDREVTLVIEDDGIGIPSADRERAFDRFVRLDPRPSREGSGLGLSIVRSIAARLDAVLQLTDGDRGGLRVEITFKTADPARPARSAARQFSGEG